MKRPVDSKCRARMSNANSERSAGLTGAQHLVGEDQYTTQKRDPDNEADGSEDEFFHFVIVMPDLTAWTQEHFVASS